MGNFGDKVSIKSAIIAFAIAVFKASSTQGQFCPGLKSSTASSAFGTWYPPNCTAAQVPVGTRCFIKCKENYVFPEGAKIEKQCVKTPLKYYSYAPDGSVTGCTGTPCPAIEITDPLIKVTPDSCRTTGLPSKRACYFTCPNGYKRVGLSQKSCLIDGTYSPLGGAYCVQEPPKTLDVKCPPGAVTVYTDSGKNTANVDGFLGWPSGAFDDAWVTFKVMSENKDIRNFSVGSHRVLFTVTGMEGQEKKYCNVFVTVKDGEPPYAKECPEEYAYNVPTGEKVTTKRFPFSFIDAVDGTKSRLQYLGVPVMGIPLGVGQYERILKARDLVGNTAVCKIPVNVMDAGKCKARNPPLNAVIEPTQTAQGLRYKSKCNGGTTLLCDVALASAGLNLGVCYLGVPCGKDGYLSNALPSCGVLPSKVNNECPVGSIPSPSGTCFPCPRSFFYNTTTKKCQLCPQNETSDNLSSTACKPCPAHQMTKSATGPRFCENICADGYAVNTVTKVCTKCPSNTYVTSGGIECKSCPSATITYKKGARSSSDCVFGRIATDISGTATLNRLSATKYTKWTLHFDPSFVPRNPLYQRMAIKITSNLLSNENDCSQSFVQVKSILGGHTAELSPKLCGSALKEPVVIKLRPWRVTILEYHYKSGQNPDMIVTFGLANCSRGHFYNLTQFKCIPCAKDTFQNETGAMSCMPCPSGRAAPSEGLAFCQEGCAAGYYRSGTRCVACDIGSYSETRESRMCQKCAGGLSTAHVGANSKALCVGACGSGFFKANDSTCSPCPVGTYQNHTSHASPMCKLCPEGTTTLGNETKSATGCRKGCALEGELFNEATKKCEKCPIGSYKYISSSVPKSCTPCPTNYTTKRTGSVTKLECVKTDASKKCKSNPCKFLGRCVEDNDTFKCICPAQYSGVLCEKALHPCAKTPCKNNGTCHDQNAITYFCDCKPGFTGRLCESEYRPCDSAPCRNNGNCTNVGNSYKCTCPPYLTGQICHITMTKPCDLKPCKRGRGECINGPFPGANPPYTCRCYHDFTGRDCESAIDDCASRPCQANTTVECEDRVKDYFCRCKRGFEGKTCNKTIVCNAGQYYEYFCKPCPKGSYQPNQGFKESCDKCPSGTTTRTTGTKQRDHCADFEDITTVSAVARFLSLVWNSELSNRESALFLNYAQMIEEDIKKVYAAYSDFLFADVDSFKQGSVIANIEIFFKSGATSPEDPFKKAVESGSVGNTTVDSNYLKLDVKKTKKSGKDNTVLIVVVVLVVLLIVGVAIGIVIWYKKCRGSGVAFNKVFERRDKNGSPNMRLEARTDK